VYYDDGWDRTLGAAGTSLTCPGGTRVRWKQNLDIAYPTFATFDAFNTFWLSGPPVALDPSKFPRDPATGCAQVFPHQFPRVNNVFELVRAAGGRTAWADKHSPYEFLNGPSGVGLDDLYAPEIATTVGQPLPPPPALPLPGVLITNSFKLTMD